jgi:hypothetical protein
MIPGRYLITFLTPRVLFAKNLKLFGKKKNNETVSRAATNWN